MGRGRSQAFADYLQNSSYRIKIIPDKNYSGPVMHCPTLAFLEKARVFLFAEPLKSLEKRGKTHKKSKIGKRKKARKSKKARIGGSGCLKIINCSNRRQGKHVVNFFNLNLLPPTQNLHLWGPEKEVCASLSCT